MVPLPRDRLRRIAQPGHKGLRRNLSRLRDQEARIVAPGFLPAFARIPAKCGCAHAWDRAAGNAAHVDKGAARTCAETLRGQPVDHRCGGVQKAEQIVAAIAVIDGRGPEFRHRIEEQGVENLLE